MSITYPITGVNTYYQNLRTIYQKIKIKTNKQTKEGEIKRARLKHGILTLQIFKLRDYDWKFNIMINFNNFFHVKFTKIK